jgi:adenylosuccinate lyase
VILPDSTTLTDYLLTKTTNLLDTMFVYPERMKANLESTGGLVFSGQLLLDLVEHGVLREHAYRLVQGHAMRAWQEGLNFRELVMNDPSITARVPAPVVEQAFDLRRQLRNMDAIFARVFGTRRPPATAGGKSPRSAARAKRSQRSRVC